MPFSRTPSPKAWTIGPCWTILARYQQSVSLVEKLTLMEELISMPSATSESDSTPEIPAVSMLRATTRTFNLLEGHQRRVGTMLVKKEMLSVEGWDALTEAEGQELMYLELVHNGIALWERRLLTSFGDLFESWLHEHSSPTLTVSEPTRSGTIAPWWLHTRTPLALSSTYQEWRNCANGYRTVCLEAGK